MNWLIYFIIAAVAFFAAMQLLIFVRARKMRGKPMPDLGDLLSEEQSRQQKLLFYFWSPACMMCRGMTPVIDQLAQKRPDIVKVNAMQNLEAAKRFNVMGTPTIVLVKDGKVEQMLVGAKSEKQILSLLD